MNRVKVPALQRAEQVIDYIASCREPPNAGEIGAVLGMAKSSLHALLHTLSELGWLQRSEAKRYTLGSKLLQWAQALPQRMDIVTCFHDAVEKTPVLNRYTLTLTMLDGHEVVYLASRESSEALGFTFRLGMRMPAVFTATGKAMLANFSTAALQAFCDEQPWPQALTQHSVRDSDALKQELAQVRIQGYSIDNGQIRMGMYCIGVAITSIPGQPQYGLAASLLEVEAGAAQLKNVQQALKQAAAQLAMLMGYISG